jgi:hypothetical protein
MSEQLFDVVFFGILQAGKDKETVIHNMAALFKTDANKLAPYFAGGRKVIKGKINASAAAKYQAALENVGLVIKIEPCEIQQSEAEKETAGTVQADISGLTLAPAGSDVIENPVDVPAQDIDDISDITMAEAGVDVIEHPVEVPPQKIDDISDITMAEAGVDVLDHPQQVTPQKIDDFSALTLADAGADIIENPKPEKKADIPDTSELSLDDESGQKAAE